MSGKPQSRRRPVKPAAPKAPALGSQLRAAEPIDTRGPLMLAVAVSVLLHVGVAWAIFKKPIGTIDPSLLEPEQRFRVSRASADLIIEDNAGDPSKGENGFQQQHPSIADSASTQSLAELSKILLDGDAPPPIDPDLTQLDQKLPDAPPETAPDKTGNSRPDIANKLPDDVLDALRTGPSVDLPFVATPSVLAKPNEGGGPNNSSDGGNGGGTFSPSNPGAKPIVPFREGPQKARAALDEAGFLDPIDTRPPPLEAPKIDVNLVEAAPDLAVGRPDLARTEIDFTALALDDAKRLKLPEHLDNDFDYFVTKFRPPPQKTGLFGLGDEKQDPFSYFRVDIRARRSLSKLKTMPKDVVYLIDTSGSIDQTWVNGAVRGVRDSLGSLNEGDRFNIVFFNESPAFFSTTGVQLADDATLARAQTFLGNAKSQGFTDVNRALSRLLVRDLAAERAYYLIFVSDGVPTRGVMNTRELINLITRDNDLKSSIYTVGIGRRQNRELLNFLSYRNKGFSVFAEQPQEAGSVIRNLASRLRYPIIKDVQLELIGLDKNEVFPHDVPNIHQGETFSLFGRFAAAEPFTARLAGTSAGTKVDFTFTRDLTQAPLGQPTIPRDWGFWKLHHLYSEMIRSGETPAIRKAIDQLRDQFKLKTLY